MDEALLDLVVVEGVVHGKFLVVVIFVGFCRYYNFLGLVRLVRYCPCPLMGEGPGVELLVGRVRRSIDPIQNLTSLIISRLTRKAASCVATVGAAADRRLRMRRRRPRG